MPRSSLSLSLKRRRSSLIGRLLKFIFLTSSSSSISSSSMSLCTAAQLIACIINHYPTCIPPTHCIMTYASQYPRYSNVLEYHRERFVNLRLSAFDSSSTRHCLTRRSSSRFTGVMSRGKFISTLLTRLDTATSSASRRPAAKDYPFAIFGHRR